MYDARIVYLLVTHYMFVGTRIVYSLEVLDVFIAATCIWKILFADECFKNVCTIAGVKSGSCHAYVLLNPM